MTSPVRRAGRLVESDGTVTTWSVATGRRGRRWRWTSLARPGAGGAAHTLETDTDGRFERLESAGEGVLLTLHREADGSLHGNRVSASGVDHIAFGPPAPAFVLVGTGMLGSAAFAAGVEAVAEAVAIEALVVGEDLGARPATVDVRPIGRRTLEIEVAGRAWSIEIDVDGLPIRPGPGSTTWSIEEG